MMTRALLISAALLVAAPSFAKPTARPPCVPLPGGGCIEATEYTNERFAAFLEDHGNECAGKPCYAPPEDRKLLVKRGESWGVIKGRDANPVVHVTWHAAKAACAHDKAALCTREQWGSACSPDGRRFAYGKAFERERCNVLERGVGATLPVGSLPTCAGGLDGLYDMSGNVWEWVDTCVKRRCLVRGGSFSTYVDYAPCGYMDGHYPVVREENIGFRCCRAAPEKKKEP